MRLTSTSTQRTYRYVRIGIIGAVVVLAVTLTLVFVFEGPQPSISAVYYTDGRTVFTGVLFAVALGLLTLAGHSVEQILLGIAALYAPIIAIVPTPHRGPDLPNAGISCPGLPGCVPDIGPERIGILTVVIAGALGIAAAAIITRRERTLTPGTVAGLVACAATVIGVLVWLLVGPASLLALGHLVAAGIFFMLMTAVAVISAVVAAPRWRVVYAIVAIGMAAALVLLGFGFTAAGGPPLVLIGEAVLIVLFGAFWIAQTVQKWNEVDPALLPAGGIPHPASR
ncbi:hypothetical protein GCM10022240_19400 [Microbacterium kribbense]|uniref:DUF998 domain-containing protein n=1 Tax=Microbacterium kribbense TaxID=433645 RepID=A0ABP7GKY5_9MICO